MAIQGIGTGLAPNDGNGDNLLAGALKINSNFNEIYTLLGDGSSLTSGIVTSIIAGTNITVSGSTGAVTINSSGSGGSGETLWRSTTVGINTISNVGIGSTGPTSKLDVVGDGKFTGVVTATSFTGNLTGDVSGGATQIYLNTTTTNSPSTGSWLIPFVDNPTGSNRPVYVTGAGWGARWFNPTKSLYVTNDTTTNQTPSAQAGYTILSPNSVTIGENVKIDGSSGIVTAVSFIGDGSQLTGLSTANIRTSSLVVSGISTFNNKVAIGTANPKGRFHVGSASSTTNEFIITNDGDVGIGTTIPEHYDGFGSLTLDGKAYQNGPLTLYGGGNILLKSRGNNAFNIYSYSSVNGIATATNIDIYHDLYFLGSTGTNLLVVTESGKVGIGTTTPTSALTVNGNVSIGGTTSIEGGVKLATNNSTVAGTIGTTGEIKQIGGVPFYYDGSAWREFVLSTGVSTTQTADTSWDNVILRSTYDTDFYDSKFEVHPILTGAGATTASSPVKIGTKSFRNNGSVGAGISYAYRSEYDFTGPWTIEFWIYHDATPGDYETLVSQWSMTDRNNNWTFGIAPISANIYWFWSDEAQASNKTLNVTATSTFNSTYLNKWVHYALVRESDNGSIHFYIDGVESSYTISDQVIDNDITSTNGAGLYIGGIENDIINTYPWNNSTSIDASFDDIRISTVARYTSVGVATTATFTPSTTALETTGTLTNAYTPPGNKRGVITLGATPSWRGTPGCTVSRQSSGNYRVSFATSYISNLDYSVLSQATDQGYASYVGIARSTEHVDISVNRQSNDAAVDTGYLTVQITNL